MTPNDRRLNKEDRLSILRRVAQLVSDKLYDERLNGVDWQVAVADVRDRVAAADDPTEFEQRINDLLRRLNVSHLGFFRTSGQNATAKQTIGVNFMEDRELNPARWVFQDVHEHSPAAVAGIERGWTLIAVNGQEAITPTQPAFNFQSANRLEVLDREMRSVCVTIEVPKSKKRATPFAEFPPVSARDLGDGVMLLKVSHFPGIVGIEVAQAISRELDALNPRKLVIDLRGNTGGGLGCLRLMSLLVPVRRPVGYTLTRRSFSRGVDVDRLIRFNRIPKNRLECLPLFPRFAFRDKSVVIETEGLGDKLFHGSVAILLNEHSASATEMVAAFAAETKSAVLIGKKTPGRVTGAKSFPVSHGYRCAIPVARYVTWGGTALEGIGVAPDVSVDETVAGLRSGRDQALLVAEETLGRLDPTNHLAQGL